MGISAYQKILGDEFAKLTPALQFGHGETANIKAIGIVDVEYGKGIFIRFLNRISNMPPEGQKMHVVLEIKRDNYKETWRRSFNGKFFTTDQFAKKGYLYEKSGFMSLVFRAFVKEGSLYLQQTQTRFAGIPLPKFMGVYTVATSTELEDGWRVSVEVQSPVLGLMLKYQGSIQIQR